MITLIQQLTGHPLTEIIGWTLVHFLWQGLLIAGLVAILLGCLRRASSTTRYLLACGGLTLMALAPMVTASWLTMAMQEARELQTANAIDHSFAINLSQGEIPRIPFASVTDDLVLNKPAIASPQDADSKTPDAAGIAWRERLRNSFPYFVVMWSLGVLLLSLRLLGGLWRVQQWRRRGIAIKTAELKEMTTRLAAVMGLNRKFELLESAQAVVPAVIGWLKPVVIVPTSLISGLSPAELESLLAHELAHIRRHDYLVNLLQTVIETVLFYHPAVWWLSRVVRYERENCCDDLAVAACGNRMVFVQALTKLEELRCDDPRLALSAQGGSLLARVQRLLAPSAANRAEVWWPAGALVLGAITLAMSSLFLAVATAESDPQQNVDKATANEKEMLQTKSWTADDLAKQDSQKSIPQVPLPNRPIPSSLKPDRSFKVESSPGDEGPTRADQVGVKVLASHTYNSPSRQSTHLIPLNDTSVPVDRGIEYQGIAIYLTLMYDLVAVDAKSGEVLWHREWSKSQPFWKTVSVVELKNEVDPKLAVELFASVPNTRDRAYLYLDLKTGTELQPPAASAQKLAADDAELVSKAKQLGDWLEFKPGFRFDSIGYMRLADDLMALDEPRRAAALRAMANAKLEGQTIALCRMLFESKPNVEFRRPGLGEPHFVGTTTEMNDCPLEPIALAGEVPLLIVNGYTLAGPRQPAMDYLQFCLANYAWTKRNFSEIEKAFAAADQAIRQPAFWGGTIDESEWREWAHLRLQLRPSLAIEVKQQPWVNIVVPLYSALDEGTWKVSEILEKIVASSLSTDAPVTLIISDSAKPEWIEPLVRLLAEAGYRNQEHIWWQKSHEPVKQPELEKILSAVQLNIQGEAEADWGAVDPKTGLRLRLTLAESSVPAGKPVLGKLELLNSGKQAAEYDPQAFSPFRVVLIADEKGKPAQFIGPRPQTSSSPRKLALGESVTLWEDIDLGEFYLLDSGNYEAKVLVNDRQRNLVLESGSVRLKVDGGQLAPKLQLLKQLREIAPADWGVSTSFGAIYLAHAPTNLKQDVTTIQLWFTDEPLPADYQLGEGEEQQQITTIGPTELGFLHLAAPKKAFTVWPEHLLMIKTAASRILNFKTTPGVRLEDKDKPSNDEDSKDQANELPWRAKGRVTNREGIPLSGVSVQAHCGFGTLFRTGNAVTDANGLYDLQFGPGGRSQNRQLVQAATISVSLDGHFEQNLHRQGDLVAALEKPDGEDVGWAGKTAKDLFLPGEPKTIDFIMLPATKFKGVVIGKDGDRLEGVRVSLTGPDLPPSSSVVAQTQTDKGGRFELTNLPTGFAYQLLIKPAKAQPPWPGWASPPLKLEPFADGFTCFSTESNGRNQLYRIQELSIQLIDKGINWKSALATAASQQVVLQIDGFDNDDETNNRVSSGNAVLRLGTDRE
jgi:beta-lactamase regulating signal transducer with metallopeptidase domain